MPDDDLLRRLRDAIEASPGLDAGELVAAAWEDAVAEARTVLQAVMTKALLEQAAAHLRQARTNSSGAEPAPAARRAAQDAGPLPPRSQADAVTWYVYGVTRAGTPAPDVTGVGGYEVLPITAGRVQAIVSRVPADDFSEAALAERVTDIEWLSREAQAHESVLAAVSGRAVLPFRFGTVYRSQERVVEFLNEHMAALTTQLDRLAGRHEWSVKALADDEVLGRWALEHDPDVAAIGQGIEARGEGHSYFARKRREHALDEARERVCSDVARECHDRLTAAASQATTARPQDPSLSGYEGRMILNGIYLVEDPALPAFRETVEQLEERYGGRGFSLVMTGPWPPHHFVDLSALGETTPAGEELLS